MKIFLISVFLKAAFCFYFSQKLKRSESLLQNSIIRFYNITKKIKQKKEEEHPTFSVEQLSNVVNVQYYGNIFVGKPSQRLTVIFDTGSNLLWLPSSPCPTCRENNNQYFPKNSKTSLDLNQEYNISFAIGFVKGKIYEDTVSINSGNNLRKLYNQELSANGYRILSVNEERNLTGTVSDGVMGLGINDEGDPKNSFIETLYNQNQITSPSFSFYLLDKKTSKLYIGDILNNEYISNLFNNSINECYVPDYSSYWQCDIAKGIMLSDKNRNNEILFPSKSSIIFDTGSSYTYIPETDFINVMTYLKMRHDCVLDDKAQLLCRCQDPSEFGFIEIMFDDKNKFVLDLEKLIEYQNEDVNYHCHFQINLNEFEMDTWILGDSSLRSNIVTFNINQRKISFIQNISGIIDDNSIARGKLIRNEGLLSSFIFWIVVGVLSIIVILSLVLYFLR